MYVAMARKWFSSLYHTIWRRNLMRSGMVTGLLLACILVGLTATYRAHMRGNFHQLKLKANIDSERQDAPVPRPGGQEAIVLMRSRLQGGSTPEFLSATMLPGRGMNVLQITAYIPGQGEVNLLASPSIDGAASAMTGRGPDASGQASMAMGGAFEAPWAGGLWGVPALAGGAVTTVWEGNTISLPAAASGGVSGEARDGLLLARGADSAASETLPDGGNSQAVFHMGSFGGHWLSNTDVTVTVLLSSRTIELTVVANNVGDVAGPIAIGWRPRFSILGGSREQLRLRIPGDMRVEMRERTKGQPTGVVVPVAGTAYDYSMIGGAKLGMANLDDYFVGLHQGLLDNGPAAELSDPAGGYGLRLTALSPTIKAMRVVAPAGADYVSIEPQYNYPDPFGREWKKDTEGGMVTLQPGESTEWKVRLEIFAPADSAPPM
jgi:aldose 1-epimerase